MIKIKWTQEKIELLKVYYPNSDWDFLFSLLECNNKEEIIRKAYKLKIKRDNYYYTDKDIIFIQENYSKLSAQEIGLHLNKSESAIRTKLNKMGLKHIESWSEVEIDLLKEKYPHFTNKELVKRFFPTRNAESIRTMANKNGIIKSDRKKSKWYSEENLINQLKELAIKLGRTPEYLK